MSDKLRYALIDLWTVILQRTNFLPLTNIRPQPILENCPNPVIDTENIPHFRTIPHKNTKHLPLSTNLQLKNKGGCYNFRCNSESNHWWLQWYSCPDMCQFRTRLTKKPIVRTANNFIWGTTSRISNIASELTFGNAECDSWTLNWSLGHPIQSTFCSQDQSNKSSNGIVFRTKFPSIQGTGRFFLCFVTVFVCGCVFVVGFVVAVVGFVVVFDDDGFVVGNGCCCCHVCGCCCPCCCCFWICCWGYCYSW